MMQSPAGLVVCALLSAAPCIVQTLPGRAIVKFAHGVRLECAGGGVRTGLADVDRLLGRYEARGLRPLVPCPDPIARASGADRSYLLIFRPDADVHEVTASLAAVAGVEGAWPDERLPLDSVPDDSMYRQQWHLAHIGAPGAWSIAHGDSNVKLAVIADGVHWTHPDLEANLWVNPAEDINHSGRFEPSAPPAGDLDFIDQDGNGYVDDVIGYDFVDNDPNPAATSQDAIGTHGTGIQNAVTDNNRGVSAPPWNVRSFALRCGSGGSIYISAAVSAIYYLTQKGCWSFCMPFGSRTSNPMLSQACIDAWNSGRIPCAGAGGDNEEPVYPAASDGVIAVAAHGRTNRKSSFSNYGTWVDITAPGDSILSTYGPDRYQSRSGVSEAAGVVVGALGWVKSAYPGIDRDSALAILRGMCDSMPDPLYLQGKLGWGRLRMSVPTTGIAESPAPGVRQAAPASTVVRGVLRLPEPGFGRDAVGVLLDVTGRCVCPLKPGANDVSGLAPGVYFARVGAEVSRVVVVR
jgi:subtilisin family serine protease